MAGEGPETLILGRNALKFCSRQNGCTKDMCARTARMPFPWEFLFALNNRFVVAVAIETIPPAVLTVTIT